MKLALALFLIVASRAVTCSQTADKISLIDEAYRRDQQYVPSPDSKEQPGVPKGRTTRHSWTNSAVFPGTVREYSVYVPAQYRTGKPAAVFVCQDGVLYEAPTVFDNLIHRKEMPVTIGIFIEPGDLPPRRKGTPGNNPGGQLAFESNRNTEYDTLSDAYSRFLLTEILPEVAKGYTLTANPEGRCIAGNSAGGICAFTVCWERPDAFRKCFTTVASFTNVRGGDKYPEIVRNSDRKPIRIFQQGSKVDLINPFGDWSMGNKAMAAALQAKGYDHRFVLGDGYHSERYGTVIFPDVMRWMWRDYPKN